jgi:hypothetical protein
MARLGGHIGAHPEGCTVGVSRSTDLRASRWEGLTGRKDHQADWRRHARR